MMKRFVLLCLILLLVVGCVDKKEVVLPADIPDFVQVSDLTSIDWQRKAVAFKDSGMIGNVNKSGVIGMDMPSLSTQKWMWHLWGTEGHNTELTIVGYHKASKDVQPILTNGWSLVLGGPNNGADAHAPSSVKVPKSGEWAILLYTNGEYFDSLIYDIHE